MKRSEMLEHIEAELNEMLSTIQNRPNASKYQPNRYANNILDMLEGFGMMPPAVEGIVKAETNEETGEIFIQPWRWEPENETVNKSN